MQSDRESKWIGGKGRSCKTIRGKGETSFFFSIILLRTVY